MLGRFFQWISCAGKKFVLLLPVVKNLSLVWKGQKYSSERI